MEKLKHFSHIHPLILGEVHEVDLFVTCNGCKKPISGVVYWCNKCDCYLHKRCAELPYQIEDPIHPHHFLTMDFIDDSGYRPFFSMFDLRRIRQDVGDYSYVCSLCRESRRRNRDSFFYMCTSCKFYICLPCFLEERSITPEFHEHPLIFLLRSASFYCNACDKEDKDLSSYICHTCPCPFWIHKSCALFLSTIQFDDQHHPLTLVKPYSSDVPLENQKDCRICGLRLTRENWLYYCALCHYQTHVRCSISRSKLLRGIESENEYNKNLHPNLLHFPLTDDFVVVSKHLVVQISHEEIKRETKIKHESHKDHELILYDGQGQNNTKMIKHDTISSCDICMQPISLPFYTCVECNHFIHLSCANLPAELERPNHSHSPSQNLFFLFLSPQKERHSLFRCTSCNLYGNGFSYENRGYYFIAGIPHTYESLHLKCAFLPSVILHETHRHPLVQIKHLGIQCRACHVMRKKIGYICEKCNFGICFHCALLPRTLRHRWDAHPLILSYPPIKDHPDEYYCEICEIEIKLGRWIYHCRDCNQSFHPECVQDKYSYVKFGATRQVNDHPHPLTFTRRVKRVRNYSCGHMFDDERPLYECVECNYTICLKCIH